MDAQVIQFCGTITTGVLIVSLFTGLTVQAIKSILKECKKDVPNNILATIVSLILSAGLSVGYAVINNIPFSGSYLAMSITLAFLGWLCACVGYDKVKQAIDQILGGK